MIIDCQNEIQMTDELQMTCVRVLGFRCATNADHCGHKHAFQNSNFKDWMNDKDAFVGISFPRMLEKPQYPDANMSASCISAITFDESTVNFSSTTSFNGDSLLHNKNLYRSLPLTSSGNNEDNRLIENEREGIVEPFLASRNHFSLSHVSQEVKNPLHSSPDRQTSFIKGSLYSRIMSGFQDAEVAGMDTYPHEIYKSVNAVNAGVPEEEEGHEEAPDDGTEASNDGDEYSIVEEIEMGDDAEDAHTEYNDVQMLPVDVSVQISEAVTDMSINEDGTEDTQEYADQWRQVQDRRTGKTYYYNRRTRESKWALPSNAILLRRKRQVGENLDNSHISSTSLREVSMSEITDDSVVQHRLNKMGPFDQGAQNSLDIMQQDEEESQYILERCRRLRDSAAITSKRRFFFPDDKNGTEDDDAMEGDELATSGQRTSWVESANEHPEEFDGDTSVQRNLFEETEATSAKSHCLFCMYCGVQVLTTNAMKQHLHLQCPRYDAFIHNDPLEHQQLQLVLGDVWSCRSKHSAEEEEAEEGDKENHRPPSSAEVKNHHTKAYDGQRKFGNDISIQKLAQEQESCIVTDNSQISITNREDIFSFSDDEDTILDNQLRQRYQSSLSDKSDEGHHMQSSCAFCSRTFRSGNKLSKHLLHCKARQTSNKKRTMHSDRSLVGSSNGGFRLNRDSSSGGNKLQSHLLTSGGRHLPGYPRMD